MSVTVITRHSTMGEVLESYPSAAILPRRSTVSEANGCQSSRRA